MLRTEGTENTKTSKIWFKKLIHFCTSPLKIMKLNPDLSACFITQKSK